MKTNAVQTMDTADLEAEFRAWRHHPYVAAHITEPEPDRDHILFLKNIISTKDMQVQEKRERILSALLVQAALDMHEEVTLQDTSTDEMRKRRQLTVLAGDYFSSLYFYFLAKLKDTEVVQVFSRSIQHINEQKMRLHQQEETTLNGVASLVREIQAGLLKNLSAYYNQAVLGETAEAFLGLKKVHAAKATYSCGGECPLLTAVQEAAAWPTGDGQAVEARLADLELAFIEELAHYREKAAPLLNEDVTARIDELIAASNAASKG
ncbi:heptaprenyl diphosphate synthase [Salsuginibacillus halophilus]|uniref:Heptaprenyl diphosphate synthase n=1 Tax=Salsuginibacillus halophilus TaxID=517424 RepID=A0A2P8HW88_9BACI|nr:heptaprenyl diphosphate synthase component 1 [Salsuginibacillus halophilus]PSL50490.1 heptaprenyl diphosphate synthase [Salsuginibacillus halophilus]